MFYLQKATKIQRAYYEACQASPSGKPEFSHLKIDNEYHRDYTAFAGFFRHLHPFQFLKEGDHVIAVGIDPTFIERRCSQALIMSAVVGRTGTVRIIEGSKRNAAAVEDYVKQHQVANVKMTNAIVSSKKGKVVFDEDPKQSVRNMVAFNQKGKKNRMALPLDEILPDCLTDHLYLTINGTESDALEGAKKLLERNPNIIITYPLDFAQLTTWETLLPCMRHDAIFVKMHKRRVALSYDLAAKGYHIAIANAPHTPSSKLPFLFASAIKCEESKLLAMGFQKYNPTLL